MERGTAESLKLGIFDMPQMVRSLNVIYSVFQAFFLSPFHSLLVRTVYAIHKFDSLHSETI